jgi:hypothetical protein
MELVARFFFGVILRLGERVLVGERRVVLAPTAAEKNLE